jgi:hypothetical protein
MPLTDDSGKRYAGAAPLRPKKPKKKKVYFGSTMNTSKGKTGFWEGVARKVDTVTRGKNADHSKAGGAGVGRAIDKVATGGSNNKPPKGAQAAAARRGKAYPTHAEYTDTIKRYKKNIKSKKYDAKTSGEMNAYRADRANRGNFKGDYYGPDAFKGNLTMVDKWRAAGSPKNTKAFAKKAAVRRSTGRGD